MRHNHYHYDGPAEDAKAFLGFVFLVLIIVYFGGC